MLIPARIQQRAIVFACAALSLCAAGCEPESGASGGVRCVFGGVGMGRGEFQYPRAIAVSPVDGCVFVIDKAARVQRFSPDGRYATEWRMPEWQNGKPTGACVDRHGCLWVADTHYARVIEYDRDGHELLRFGRNGEGPGEFIWPTNIAIDADDFVYVGEYGGNDRISKFTPRGRFVSCFARGEESAGGTIRPQGLSFDRDGVLWVADAGHHRICHYSREGSFLGAFGSLGSDAGQFRFPYDVVAMPDGTLVISDYGNNRLVRATRGGRVIGTWGATGRELGQLVHPWSVDIGPAGDLYVMDSWNSRVQVVRW